MAPVEQHITPLQEPLHQEPYDYSHVHTAARVAVYDDMKMPPRIIEVAPAATAQFIENLASCINEQKTLLGGNIPYSAIREVAENCIHAQFKNVVVSILDNGNTIRFCDQGPGIQNKEKAVLPGYTSATDVMSAYIRGVGSGLPIVKEYLDVSQGTLSIEDNIEHGAVVTLSLTPSPIQEETTSKNNSSYSLPIPPLSEREQHVFSLFPQEGALGVSDVVNLTGIAQSSVYVTLQKLEECGLIEKTRNKKRMLTDYGYAVSQQIL